MKYYEKCLICQGEQFKPVYQKKWRQSNFVQCKKCRLILQNPQENPAATVERYNEDYFQYEVSNQFNFFQLIKKTLADYRILDLLPAGAQVLEIGSATGLFLKYMQDNGHQSIGLEICKQSVDYGKKNHQVNLVNAPLTRHLFPDQSFDFVHFSHLIEHLNAPDDFLDIIFTIMKKGSYLLVTTPNQSGLFSRYYTDQWRCIVDDHLFLFNKSNLKKLLENKGFKIIRSLTWGSIPAGHRFLKPVKKMTDWLVKKTGTGDVISYLVQK